MLTVIPQRLWTRLLAEFAAQHPQYGTPAGAHNRCVEASSAFCDFVLDAGLPAYAAGRRVVYTDEVAVIDGVSHKAAFVHGRVIDWTARQFHPELPWPLVMHQTEMDRYVYPRDTGPLGTEATP